MRDDPKWNIQFVKLVEKYPVLYDAGNEGYCSKDSVEEAWREVAGAMRESVINCKDKWRNLRTSLTRHLRNMNEPSALSGKYRRPYYMAPYMAFLIPYTKSRSYKTESLSTERPRRSSFDCSFDRRYPDRGDSSSYDNSFGPILEDHETARPQDREEDRQGPRAKGPRAGEGATAVDHADAARRVQPKLEEPDEDAERADELDAEADGGGGAEEEEEDVEAEEEEAEGGGERKRRKVAAVEADGPPPSDSGAAATPSGAPGPVGSRPGRACVDLWEAAREMDDDSWSGWFREGGEAWAGEERRAAARATRPRASRGSGHPDARHPHPGAEQSNADMDFFRSILWDVNSLTPPQRSKFRLSVLKTLHEMLYDEP